jgi:hypothetical protein
MSRDDSDHAHGLLKHVSKLGKRAILMLLMGLIAATLAATCTLTPELAHFGMGCMLTAASSTMATRTWALWRGICNNPHHSPADPRE